MESRKLILHNEEGLHARSAALFVRMANKFNADISLEAHGEKVNGKSIIGIMSLGVFSGEEVIITAEGSDEKVAIEELERLIQNNFIYE